MKFILAFFLLTTQCLAGITVATDAGQTLYVRFGDTDNTAVDLTEGATLKAGTYTASDGAITTASLDAGTYIARICVGTAGAQSASDEVIAIVPVFHWSGTAELAFKSASITEDAFDSGVLFDPDTDQVASVGSVDYIVGQTTGTSDSGTTTTMVDAARTESNDDYWNNALIVFTSGTLAGQSRVITDFVASSDTITFAPAASVAVGTHTYTIIPDGTVGGLTAYDAATDTDLDSISGLVETRDLRPVSAVNTWTMVQRATGVVSANTITIYQGETKRCAFDCSRLMPNGEVLATMAAPTASVANLTPTEVGIDAKQAKITLACGAAVAAGTYTVRTTISTDPDSGPILLIATVLVVED
jgi:hypothetical protein